MTESQLKSILELRSEGYAVCLFSPEELQGFDPLLVQEGMTVAASQAIDELRAYDEE